MKYTSCLASLKAYFQNLYQQYNRAFVVLFLGFSVMGCGNKVVRQVGAGSGSGGDSTITTGGGGTTTTTTEDDPVVDNRIFDVGAPFNPPNINPYFNGLQAPPLAQGYRALATLLFNNYLLNGNGLSFQHEVGSFSVVGNRLVPNEDPHKNVALSNLGISLRHTYMGSTVFADVSANAFGGLFADHHNPNATDHCWNSCELIHKNGSYYVRILSRYGTTQFTLMEQQVNQSSGFLECVNYHETIVAYLDGKYIAAAKDPFETEKVFDQGGGDLPSHAGLLGFRARDAEFGSAVVANINAIPASVLVVFYDDFQTSQGSSLGPAWNFSSIQQQGGLAVSSSTATAQLADTDVEDADVIIEYNLLASGASVGVSARSVLEARATLDGSNLRLTLRKNGSVLSTQDLGAVGTTGYLRIRVKDERVEVFQHFDYVPLMQSTPILTTNLSSSEWNHNRASNNVYGTGSIQKGTVGMLISAQAQVNQFLYLEPNGPGDL